MENSQMQILKAALAAVEGQKNILESIRTLAVEQAKRELELAQLIGVAIGDMSKTSDERNILVLVLEKHLANRKEAGATAGELVSAEAVLSALRLRL